MLEKLNFSRTLVVACRSPLGRQSHRLQRRRIAVIWALAPARGKGPPQLRSLRPSRVHRRQPGRPTSGRVILTNADLTLSPWILPHRMRGAAGPCGMPETRIPPAFLPLIETARSAQPLCAIPRGNPPGDSDRAPKRTLAADQPEPRPERDGLRRYGSGHRPCNRAVPTPPGSPCHAAAYNAVSNA